MDTTTLVENWISEGNRVVEALVTSQVPVDAALWLYFPEAAEWRLVVATPLYDTRGPRASYTRIRSVLSSLTPPTPIRLWDVTVRSPTDELIAALRSANRRGTGVVGQRLRGVVLDGVFIEDAYVYRITDRAFQPVELPRRAVPLADIGASDDQSWNTYLLAGLLGLPVQQIQGMGVPDPVTVKALEDWLNQARGHGLIKRWEGNTTATGYFESSHTWAYQITLRLHKGYYPVVLPRDGRLVMLCGVREERQERHGPGEQVLVSSPAIVEEWLRCPEFLRRYRPLRSGELFVKPDGEIRESEQK
jgi:hypothetical protein